MVLSALLVGAGLGAMLSPRLVPFAKRAVGLALPIVILILNVGMGMAFDATLGWSLGWRVATAIALVVPVGVLMGAPFPLGMMLAGTSDRDPSSLRAWYWAMNGMASVLATVLSLVTAMTIGFTATVALGAGAYVLAGWVLSAPAAKP